MFMVDETLNYTKGESVARVKRIERTFDDQFCTSAVIDETAMATTDLVTAPRPTCSFNSSVSSVKTN